MKLLITLALKDLKLLLRDTFALFWILAFPVMFALFFGSMFGGQGGGGGSGIPITIVDEDQSELSAALVQRLVDHDAVRLFLSSEEDDAPLEQLGREGAREAVRKGRRTAYLLIGAGYGDNPYAIFGGGDSLPLELGIDPSRQAEAGMLQGVLMESVFGVLTDRFSDSAAVQADIAGAQREIAEADDLGGTQKFVLQSFMGALSVFVDQFDMGSLGGGADGAGAGGDEGDTAGGFGMSNPVQVVDVSRDSTVTPSSYQITFPQALVWGLMSVSLGFAITLVRERTAGTLLRLRMAPVSRAQLLAGKALACFVACLGTMSVLLAFGSLALGVTIDSLPLLLLAMVCVSLCFTGLMMTVSVMGKTEAAVAGSSWGLMMPLAMIGGGMVPLIAMPSWLVTASAISPFRWSIEAIEGAIWRGYDMSDMLLPCVVLIGTGALFFALGVTIFRRTT